MGHAVPPLDFHLFLYHVTYALCLLYPEFEVSIIGRKPIDAPTLGILMVFWVHERR